MLHHGIRVVVGGLGENGASNDIDSDLLSSPLNLSPVFRNRQIVVELKGHVRVIYPWEEEEDNGSTGSISQQCVMRLTGIPPHVVQLAQIKQLQGLAGC